MRTILAVCAVLSIFTTGASAAVDYVLNATVIGTVTVAETVAPGKTRFRTTKLDTNRLFAELGLSKQIYALGLYADGSVIGLAFYPKSAADPTSPKVIFSFNTFTATINDTKLNMQRFLGDTNPSAQGGLFSGFAASVSGTSKINLIPVPNVTKVTLSVRGHGTNVNGGANGSSAILNFKVTTGKKFVQGP